MKTHFDQNRTALLVALFLLNFGYTAFTTSSHARTRELIRNGTFAQGLSRWTTTGSDPMIAKFFSDGVGSTTPTTMGTTAPNPKGGALYAVTDQSGSSFTILLQKFRVPKGAKRVILGYQMFAHSKAPTTLNPAVFDTSGTNQQARVDLLKGNSPATGLGGNIVKPLYTKGADAVNSINPVPFRSYRFNITRQAKPGRTYQIRFATTVTENNLHLGVDNVSVKSR